MPERRPDGTSRLMLFFAIVYTVEGFCQAKVGIVWQPLAHYLKETQGWDTLQIAASLAVLDVPWVVKPLYGMVSDFLPLFGYRRRSYLLLANAGAVAAFLWTTQVLAPAGDRARIAADRDRDGHREHGVRRAAGGERPEAQRKRRVHQSAVAVVQRRRDGGIARRRRADRDPVTSRRIARCCRNRRRGIRSLVIASSIALVDEQRAAMNVAEFQRALRGFLDCIPFAHAVADRGLPVPLLFQPRLRHTALFLHDRSSALLPGHDRPVVIGQRRWLDRRRTGLPISAARHDDTRPAQSQHSGRHAGDADVSRHGRCDQRHHGVFRQRCRRHDRQHRHVDAWPPITVRNARKASPSPR